MPSRRISSCCQHLIGDPIGFLFQLVVTRTYGKLGLQAPFALAFVAMAGQ
jgi:hypothetical protein